MRISTQIRTLWILLVSSNVTRQTTLTNDDDLITNYDENSNKTETDLKKDVEEAALGGLEDMRELHAIKEPLLYKMGFYLNDEEPAAKLVNFKEQNIEAALQSKYGYAVIRATLRLAEKTNSLKQSRESQDFSPENIAADVLSNLCPLKPTPRCGPASRRYRTADGTCNNLKSPKKGSSLSPYQRFLRPSYEDGVQSPRKSVFGKELPSAREISGVIHKAKDVEIPMVSLMFMQWGQFIDHDVVSTASSRAFNNSIPRCCLPGGIGVLPQEFLHPECLPIIVPNSDIFYSDFNVRCLEFTRSSPSLKIDCKLGFREQINQATSFLDASAIYGNTFRKSESLRTFKSGKLFFEESCKFGIVSSDCFSAGDSRFSEQPSLNALHTIWVKFHNKIAETLAIMNGHWSDEKLYQETRRIIGALIQHITYREFLPIVLGAEVMELFELKVLRRGFYDGYDERVDSSTGNAFATAAFRFGHSLVQKSFVRSTTNHRMIANNVSLHEEPGNFDNLLTPGSLDRLILGLVNQPSQMRDEFVSEELTNRLFQSHRNSFGIDLIATNIQRGRDHGIPSYTSWRSPCGLSEIKSFEDLLKVMSKETVLRLSRIYDSVEDIDLYSGGLAEKPIRGGLVGPVFACVIAQQFLNYKKGDRFWYENGKLESSFNLDQLNEIRRVSFAEVLCYTLGEIDTIQNFVFLLTDDEKNRRKSCEEIVSEGFDLRQWKEDFGTSNLIRRFNKKSLNLNQTDDYKSRYIDEYIMESLDDFYDNYDYEEIPNSKPIRKRKRKPTKRPNPITKKITTESMKMKTTTSKIPLKIEEEFSTKTPSFYNDNKFDLIHKKVTPLKVIENEERDILVLHDFPRLNPKIQEGEDRKNYQVNININYILGNNIQTTTPRNPKPFSGVTKPHSNQDKRPLVSYNLPSQKPNNYPIYLLNNPVTMTTTSTTKRPEHYVTGYQLKKTTTNRYQDVPIFVSSNSHKYDYFTTKKDVDYDPIYEDVTTTKRPNRPTFQNFNTNRPNFQNFPTNRPNFQNFPTNRPTFQNNHGTVLSRPIHVTDPIDDVYMTILQKPTNFGFNKKDDNDGNNPIKNASPVISDKLDFKSVLLPSKLKVKNTNMVKISSSKSSENYERSSGGSMERGIVLPELDGVQVVEIEVFPSETKFSSKQNVRSPKNATNFEQILNSEWEFNTELPRKMKLI